MVNFFRWLLGYIEFSFSKGFCEGFLNDCYEKHIAVFDIRRNGASLNAKCSIKSYFKLHRIALKNGGAVSILKKRGPVFVLAKYRGRAGLFCGLVCYALIMCFLTGFVWNIEISGNAEIEDSQIISFLDENDFAVGTYWKSADKSKLENLMMASFEKCAWVHINKIGTTALVEINETVDIPDTADNSGFTNLKATKDGIIVSAVVYGGHQIARKGDSVVAGDLLASGVYESKEAKRNIFSHASGVFIAQVNEKTEMTVSRQQVKKIYEKKRRYNTLNFFGINIPLYIGSSYCMNSDDSLSRKYITINSKTLPIGITTKTVRPYSAKTVVLDDSELKALVSSEIKKQIKRDFGDYEIISQDIEIDLNSDNAAASAKLVCLENIAKEYPLKKQ